MKSMRVVLMVMAGLAIAGVAKAEEVVVTPVLKTTTTATGQPIQLPQGPVELSAVTYEIAPGAALPVHKHPYPRYAYVLSGTIAVDNVEAGKTITYRAGDVIVEAVDQWHKGTNIGTDPVKLLVIDLAGAGAKNVVLQK